MKYADVVIFLEYLVYFFVLSVVGYKFPDLLLSNRDTFSNYIKWGSGFVLVLSLLVSLFIKTKEWRYCQLIVGAIISLEVFLLSIINNIFFFKALIFIINSTLIMGILMMIYLIKKKTKNKIT